MKKKFVANSKKVTGSLILGKGHLINTFEPALLDPKNPDVSAAIEKGLLIPFKEGMKKPKPIKPDLKPIPDSIKTAPEPPKEDAPTPNVTIGLEGKGLSLNDESDPESVPEEEPETEPEQESDSETEPEQESDSETGPAEDPKEPAKQPRKRGKGKKRK